MREARLQQALLQQAKPLCKCVVFLPCPPASQQVLLILPRLSGAQVTQLFVETAVEVMLRALHLGAAPETPIVGPGYVFFECEYLLK
mmetsp:Transcript_100142/g.188648  ORF Transcript_100142/g.188648 Transcript_100142/m.188648 type:complete len:87 (-) Transcript_100142:1404-1664(-)